MLEAGKPHDIKYSSFKSQSATSSSDADGRNLMKRNTAASVCGRPHACVIGDPRRGVWPTARSNATLVLVLGCLLGCCQREVHAADPAVKYNRDVRPILADKCFHCHGPDAAARQADLRLDVREEAMADQGGHRAIAPGRPAMSELIRRITSNDGDVRMPPPDSGVSVTDEEITVLRQWIKQGATYQRHWSFISPVRPALPDVRMKAWAKHEIDRFVLAKLERAGMQPSAPADSATLIRRLSLDLTGLPPTIEEIDVFEQQSMQDVENAYGRLIDRLLSSSRYGEHMAVNWLDAARYADTNGYFTDNDRTMWPWRDWVIRALNNNMPFDQFTIEQLAGDLLPNATIDQKIATGFNRNHMVNNETGIIEEEFRVEYVVDRVDTTATVWMGLTLGCARCHDHKYDPVSQKDFYRFFAFFNNVPERGLSGSGGNSAPILKVPAGDLQIRLEKVRRDVAAAEREFAAVQKELDAAQSEWEQTAAKRPPEPATEGLVGHYALDEAIDRSMTTGSVASVAGMLGNAAKFNGDGCISVPDGVDFDRDAAFSFGAWIWPSSAGCIISRMDDANEMRGFDVTLRKNKAIVNLVHSWNRNAIRVSTTGSIPSRQWQHLMVTYDGSSTAAGVTIYLDGVPQRVEIVHDTLTDTIRNTQPLRIGRRQASASLKGIVDDVRIYDRPLRREEVARLADSQLIRGVLSRPLAERSEALKRKLRAWFVEHHADQRIAQVTTRLAELRQLANAIAQSVPTTMVMRDSEKSRQAFVLVRGEYDQHGETVSAGVPEFLSEVRPASETSSPQNSGLAESQNNRLDLAKWLVRADHPLTARVTVNRLWQQLLGTGMVKTTDDFGTQGDWPSHPELLDWLATELVASGWDIKHVLRLIVTSATYRQSSNASADDYSNDPENRLLARGPRFRMTAEMLRDNALAISGLLVEKIGGPPVKPYQPAGLWKDVTYDSGSEYRQDKGGSLYRRSLYSFWKRQSPSPNMLVFDATTRETCTVQRSRTNTPLQALVLMNDPTFVEASRRLAERTMKLPDADSINQIQFAFRSATARLPSADEVMILLDIFDAQKAAFLQNRNAATKLLSVGDSKRDGSLDIAELAAWTTVASMILSLDETLTRR